MRWVVLLTAVVVLLSVWPSAPVERTHASGIALLPPVDVRRFTREYERVGEATLQPLQIAWSDARDLAEQEPELFGVPWLDIEDRQLVVRLAQPEAEGIARAWMASGYQRGNGTKPAPSLRPTSATVKLERTTRSFAYLRSIMDGSIDHPALGLRGGTARVWTIGIDDASQRVVFESDRVVDSFLYALARTYGPDVVALRVNPRSGPFCIGSAPLDPSREFSDPCAPPSPAPLMARDLEGHREYSFAAAVAALSLVAIGMTLLARRMRRASG